MSKVESVAFRNEYRVGALALASTEEILIGGLEIVIGEVFVALLSHFLRDTIMERKVQLLPRFYYRVSLYKLQSDVCRCRAAEG